MKIKPKFQIGDWVKCKAYVEFDYNPEQRVVNKTNLEKPIIGQIVGAKRKFMGQYKPGGYDDQAYLAVNGSLVVWLVRDGYLNKPYEVLEEDVELYLTEDIRLIHKSTPILPWRKTNMTWSESDKAYLRKLMKDVPRDSKGRWLK
jgi:hypothetical protein